MIYNLQDISCSDGISQSSKSSEDQQTLTQNVMQCIPGKEHQVGSLTGSTDGGA